MKSFNTQYKDLDSLKEYIFLNAITDEYTLLIQIFSGVIDETLALEISGNLKKLLPNSNIIGSTTSGEILSGEVYKETITISFSLFENTTVKSNFYKLDNEFKIKNIVDDLFEDNTKALIIFSDGLNSNAEKLLKELYLVNPDIIIAGGRAGDNAEFKRTFVFDEKEFSEEACVVAALNSDELIVYSDYMLNWTPIGKDMIVTRVDNNILYELDGMPILDVYEKYLGPEVRKNLPRSSMEFPLVVTKNNLHVARDPIAKTEDDALIFAGNFEKGDRVRFSFGNIDDTSLGNKKYFERFNKFPSESIFVYSCTARKSLMRDSIDEEFNVLESLSPTVGFFTYGEYFHAGDIAELLNVTTTFLSLSEASSVEKKELRKMPIQEYDLSKKALTNLIKVTNQELKHISAHDMLTSLYNRAEYIQRVSLKVKSAQRYSEHFGLMLIDIDYFKLVNDNYGHSVGDEVLKKFANILMKNVREDDFVARWGGEEFVIIVNYATLSDLEKLTSKIQKKIAESSFSPVPRLTASFGLSVYMDGDNEDTLFKRVDNALYTAKQNGRNTYVIG